MDDTLDIAVVGAGLAGLTAARLVASRGLRVAVFEPHPPGGRARTDEMQGFRFNRGPHALYVDGAGRSVLRRLGIDPLGSPPRASRTHGLLGDSLLALPTTARSLMTTRVLGVRGKVGVARLLRAIPRLHPADHAHESVATWLASYDLVPDAERLALLLVRVSTYSNAPDVLSADAAITQLQLALRSGVLYLDGGWQRIVDALRKGVEVRRVRVHAVSSDGLDHIVETDTGPERCRAVIIAVGPPAGAASLLANHPDFAVGPPAEATCLDLGVRRLPDPPIVFGLDRPLYLSTHCPPADLAPSGHGVVQLARYLTPSDTTSADEDRKELEALARRVGISDDDIVTSRFLRRMAAVTALPAASLGGLAGRPPVVVDGQPGVFLAGDWVGPTGYLADASLASAAAAAELAAALVPA